MMCLLRIVLFPSWARDLISTLTVTAWLLLGSAGAWQAYDEVRTRMPTATIHCRPLSTCGERGYCCRERQQPGRIDLQPSERKLGGESFIRIQHRTIALKDLAALTESANLSCINTVDLSTSTR
jgi:hypothetical protein